MSTALAKPTEKFLQVGTPFTREQIDLIKRNIAKDASDDELKLFLAQCQRTRLDPFNREIYFIKRRQKNRKTNEWEEIGKTEVSIDGFRVIAERTGEQDGSETAWCDETGDWKDVWLSNHPPAAARVRVFRKGCAHPFVAVVRFDEFVVLTSDGRRAGLWGKMPANQLAKCGEAQALRKAFPQQLSGLYTGDEMAQSAYERDDDIIVPKAATSAITSSATPPVANPDVASPTPTAAESAVIDQQTGEEWPSPPAGFHYVRHYTKSTYGWHEAIILNWDAQGGALKVSTKNAVGEKLQEAEANRLPVRITIREKSPRVPGEAYLDKLWFYEKSLDDVPF